MNKRLWKTAAISGGISVLVAVLLLAGIVLLSLQEEEPTKNLVLWTSVTASLGGVVAGGLGALRNEKTAGGTALLSGAVYVTILCLITAPFGQGFSFGALLMNAVLPLTFAGGTGYLIGIKGTTRHGNRRKAAKHADKIYKGKRK